MQVYGMQCVDSGRAKVSLRRSYADGAAEKDEANGQKETIIFRNVQSYLIHPQHYFTAFIATNYFICF